MNMQRLGQKQVKGFSLLELVVAMAIFMLISGAAISLFRQQQIASQSLTGQVGLNLALRNAVSQIQMDLANAGSGYFPGTNMPSWPVGVTIGNNFVTNGNTCYNAGTFTYGANCFDRLNIISVANPATNPPIHASDSTGAAGLGNCSVTSSGTAYGQAATGLTLAQTAATFSRGDQLLFLNSGGTLLTTVVLTSNPTVAGGAVRFSFSATNADGSNSGGPSGSKDPLDITTCDGHSPCSLVTNSPPAILPKLTNTFCGSDWILKLSPITYRVDIATDPSNPRLVRSQAGVDAVVMEQIIGFKVGATIWNGSTGTVNNVYNYNASTYTDNGNDRSYNFSLVRSVRVSLIGRTTPDFRGTYQYRNGFDNGPYQVQGSAVVVNPRNMSMND
jgi:prepilin-type N-terminal cleavage/methylation domain-containing protein